MEKSTKSPFQKCLVCLRHVSTKPDMEDTISNGFRFRRNESNSDYLAEEEQQNFGPCSQSLTKQLRVIFILRNVLNLPLKQLEAYLERFGNPEDWGICLCSTCNDEIEKIFDLFEQLRKLCEHYEDAKRKVKRKILSKQTDIIEEPDGLNNLILECRKAVSAKSAQFKNYDHDHPKTLDLLRRFKSRDNHDECSIAELGQVKVELEIPLDDDNDFDPGDWNFSWASHLPCGEKEDISTTESNIKLSSPDNLLFTINDTRQQLRNSHLTRRTRTSKSVKGSKTIGQNTKSLSRSRRKLKNPVCDDDDIGKTLELHQIYSTKKKYLCTHEGCGKMFLDRRNFRAHTSQHQAIDPKFECSDCGRKYYLRRSLYQHRLKTHRKPTPSLIQLEKTNYITPEMDKFSKSDEESLRLKTRQEPSFKNNIIIRDNKRMYQCDVEGCAQVYSDRERFKIHMFKHEGKPPSFRCKDCDKVYYHKKHRNRKHADPTTQANEVDDDFSGLCHNCGKRFTRQSQFKAHVWKCGKTPKKKAVKTKPKTVEKFVCHICARTFSAAKYLQQHLAASVHVKDLKHNCSMCEYATVTKKDMLRHMSGKHNIGKFKCTWEGCSRQFHRERDLKDHENYTHLGLEKPKSKICRICGKGFHSTQGLKKHACNKEENNPVE